ncbi:hypothetical protein HanRHA438_Chr04g0196561 [Helianthus annuus]|nr:hypothetical protein HanIR_Chr04g0201281 [Helianthus annuus]KAJ0928662.1 hypothetical protein HanRHA438_Chr04g0196561 [Helianthus annuus]
MMVGFYIFGWFCFQVNLPSLLLLQLCVCMEMKVCVHVFKEYEKRKCMMEPNNPFPFSLSNYMINTTSIYIRFS